MVKKREMRGQPEKKIGCPDRRWMLEENSIGRLREERVPLKNQTRCNCHK